MIRIGRPGPASSLSVLAARSRSARQRRDLCRALDSVSEPKQIDDCWPIFALRIKRHASCCPFPGRQGLSPLSGVRRLPHRRAAGFLHRRSCDGDGAAVADTRCEALPQLFPGGGADHALMRAFRTSPGALADDRQRMDPVGQFLHQRRVDEAVAVQPALAGEAHRRRRPPGNGFRRPRASRHGPDAGGIRRSPRGGSATAHSAGSW